MNKENIGLDVNFNEQATFDEFLAEAQKEFSIKFSHFLTKTETQYTSTGLNYLPDRGIENRLLDNLLEFLPDGAIISGGFALSVIQDDKNAKDIDFFFTSKEAFDKTLELFRTATDEEWAYGGYTIVEESLKPESRYVSLTHPTRPHVQLMKMVWYENAAHVIDTFDFTISQFAFTNKNFIFNGAAMMDVAKKRLVLHRIQFPASTLRRVIKYASKGYYACPGSLVNICKAIQDFDGSPDINEVVYVD